MLISAKASGHDEELFELISSANVATGFHAGDPRSIFAVHSERYRNRSRSRSASKFRSTAKTSGEKKSRFRTRMFRRSWSISRRLSVHCLRSGNKGANHVKPHGALYNMAVRDQKMAEAIAQQSWQSIPTLILFAPN